MQTWKCWDPHWGCLHGWRSHHWANCSNCVFCHHWGLPLRSWTLEWFQLHCSQMDRWTAGLLLGQHCCVHFRCTGLASLWHWTNHWFWFVTTPHCTVSWRLSRRLWRHWRPSTVFTMTIVGLLAHLMRSCHWTALRAVLVLASSCLLLPGSLWTRWKLSWTAINRLEFTAEDLLDTAFSLSINSNWPTKFSLTALGKASTLMRQCPSIRRTSLLHKLTLNKLTQLARSTWRSLVFQSALMRWLWLSLAEYDIVIFDALFFGHCYVD